MVSFALRWRMRPVGRGMVPFARRPTRSGTGPRQGGMHASRAVSETGRGVPDAKRTRRVWMAAKISDSELLEVIEAYMDADIICKKARITLKTLQTRVAKLTYKKEFSNPSAIAGLYKPVSKTVKMNRNSIIIPKAKLEDGNFVTGDRFSLSIENHRIILTRL